MPRAIPFRSYGLDLGDSDLPALAQVQKMKQANLIERDLPQRKSTGTGLCEVPKVSLSGFDERRSPVSLDCVRGFVNSSSNTACLLVVGGTIVPVTHREENHVVPTPPSIEGEPEGYVSAATYDPRQHKIPNTGCRNR